MGSEQLTHYSLFTNHYSLIICQDEHEVTKNIHQHQILYKLFDEQSNELTGHIESIAWEKFHGEDA